MNMIMMAVMLFCTVGIAGFLYTLPINRDKTYTSAQCMSVTVIGIIGVMALFGFVGRLFPAMSIGVALLLVLGIYGHLRLAFGSVEVQGGRLSLTDRGRELLSGFYSPALLLCAAAFTVSLILNRGLLVYRYDDLKQWGTAAKFMSENGYMPREQEFFGSHNHYLTTTFFTSYFGTGGRWVAGHLPEHDLYAANMLMIAVGLSLPLGELGWKHWSKSVGIFVLSLLGITALYYHSTANLYVDVILSAWVGGLIGWMMLRRRLKGAFDRRNLGFLALMLAFTLFIKWGYGILSVVLLLAAWFLIEYSMRPALERWVNGLFRSVRFWAGAVGVLLFGAAVIWLLSIIFGENLNKLLPGAGNLITSTLDILLERTDKATLTKDACILGLFDQNVTRGVFHYGALVALCLLGGLGYLQTQGIESRPYARMMRLLHTVWLCGSVLWFALILVTYVSNFAYAEATIALSFNRYMGLYLMIGYFVMLLSLYLPEEYLTARKHTDSGYIFAPVGKKTKGLTMRSFLQVLLAFLLILNVNTDLVTESCGISTDSITGYKTVAAVHEQSKLVREFTNAEDAILYIAQGGAERGLHRARMDVGMNVSAYKPNSYKFASEGDPGYDLSTIRTPEELPQLLLDGGYAYIWVYKSNKELNHFTKEYFGLQLKNASLYRVTVVGGRPELSYYGALE